MNAPWKYKQPQVVPEMSSGDIYEMYEKRTIDANNYLPIISNDENQITFEGNFTGYQNGKNYFEGTRIRVVNYEYFKYGAAMTIPGIGIFVGIGSLYDFDLLKHEYGHILQCKEWGFIYFGLK